MSDGGSTGSPVTGGRGDGKQNGSGPSGVGDALAQAAGAADALATPTAKQIANDGDSGDGIAGMSVLRGLIVYAAVLAFACLYVDFIILISGAAPNKPPSIAATLFSGAAALAGILGSAFALRVGNQGSHAVINQQLQQHLDRTSPEKKTERMWWDAAMGKVRMALSLEASAPDAKSWPITCGIWLYAIVGSAVAVTYALNQNETPGPIKALAVTFAGYVIAFLSVAFGVRTSGSNGPASQQSEQPPSA